MFDLGQPNLVLLALMLFGFWLLQHGRPWMAGSMFALATAIKVFPVAVFPYLIWRRQWAAVAGMVVFLGVFLFVLPAPFRGYQHNVSELKTWYQGMVGSSSEKGFGQRDEQNWSWVNQSIIAMTHRLTRPINYNQDDPNNPNKPPRTMNLVDLGFKTANWIVLAISFLIGIGFLAVMPSRARMTPRSTAEELGILFCLMTVASPLARQYYFMWLFFPLTVLIHRAAYDSRAGGPDRHVGRAGGCGRPDAAVVAGLSERSAGLGEQPCGHRRDCGRIGLAYPASAVGCRCGCLVSDRRWATTEPHQHHR